MTLAHVTQSAKLQMERHGFEYRDIALALVEPEEVREQTYKHWQNIVYRRDNVSVIVSNPGNRVVAVVPRGTEREPGVRVA